jgi:hypothetical protein
MRARWQRTPRELASWRLALREKTFSVERRLRLDFFEAGSEPAASDPTFRRLGKVDL